MLEEAGSLVRKPQLEPSHLAAVSVVFIHCLRTCWLPLSPWRSDCESSLPCLRHGSHGAETLSQRMSTSPSTAGVTLHERL